MSFNWAPSISRDIAFAKLAGKTPTAVAINPSIFSDMRLQKRKVYVIWFDPELDSYTFDGVPIGPPWPPRCEICGRLLPWSIRESRALSSDGPDEKQRGA